MQRQARLSSDGAAAYDAYRSIEDQHETNLSDGLAVRISGRVTDVGSFYALALSVPYYAANALSNVTVGIPYLSALPLPNGKLLGLGKAQGYLRDAYDGAFGFFTKEGLSEFIRASKRFAGKGTLSIHARIEQVFNEFAKTPEEHALLRQLYEEQRLDFNFFNTIEEALASGKADLKFQQLMKLAMAFPQQGETMNRVTFALAAYRALRDHNVPHAEAVDVVDKGVREVHVDYSPSNRPAAFNKPMLRMALQFQLYTQHMFVLYGRAVYNAVAGKSPQQKASARALLRNTALIQGVLNGATGLGPIGGLAKLALWSFAAMDGKNDADDWLTGEQLLQKFGDQTFGEGGGRLLNGGVLSWLGLDMSTRAGFPNPFDSRYMPVSMRDDPQAALYWRVANTLGGATLSQAASVVQDLQGAARAARTGD
jgi:hypothetical protein